MTEAARNRRPKQSGFAPACFDAPIEAEFRAHYAAQNRVFLRTAAALGLLLVAVVALLDWRLRSAELVAYWPILRLGMAIPLLLVLLGTYPGALSRQLGVWSVLAAISLGGGSAWLMASTSGSAAHGDLAGIYAVTMFVYLALGFRLVAAVAVTVPLAVISVWILSQPWAGLAATEHATLLLVFVNVVGALSCYRLEHAARTAFLERQIVHILSATDSVTGVPNRRYFDTQLQQIRRQAQRESGGLAVALIDIDHFAALERLAGAAAGEDALRKVAQSVMQSARRPLDFAARFAAAQIAVVLYDCNPDYLRRLGRQIRERVAMLDIANPGAPGGRCLSVSIGIAWSNPGQGPSAADLLDCAGRALEEARSVQGLALLPVAPTAESQIMRGPWATSIED